MKDVAANGRLLRRARSAGPRPEPGNQARQEDDRRSVREANQLWADIAVRRCPFPGGGGGGGGNKLLRRYLGARARTPGREGPLGPGTSTRRLFFFFFRSPGVTLKGEKKKWGRD
jgi:hypothetical protein